MNRNFFKNKSILLTGGTGSFGQAFTDYLLNDYKKIKKLIILSRDELKQHDMEKRFNFKNYPKVSSEELLSGMYHIVFKKI